MCHYYNINMDNWKFFNIIERWDNNMNMWEWLRKIIWGKPRRNKGKSGK